MPQPTLRILFITAEPEDQVRPDNTLELQTIQNALQSSGAAIEAHFVFRATRKLVVRELQFDPDIVHFLCHGEKEHLVLEDDDGVTSRVDADWLVDVFSGYPRLRVVFLNACESAAIARTLVASERTRIAAAIGWNSVVREDIVRRFAATWYGFLKDDVTTAAAAFVTAQQSSSLSIAEMPLLAERPPPPPPPPGPGLLPFTPSNLVLDDIDPASLGDLEIGDLDWKLKTNEATWSSEPPYVFRLVEQADGSQLAVYFVRNLTIRPNASIAVVGTNPCAIVAREQLRVYGGLYAAVTGNDVSPGGFRSDGSDRAQAGGPGGGAPRSAIQAGAGGSFGGRGGAGLGGSPAQQAGEPGPTYGNPELSPLVGGSAGGDGGTGGGAIQLVAGHKLLVGVRGWISCGGAGGNASGPIGAGHGYGGGSGGAVLIEAPLVEIAGVVAANGGGGGATWGGDHGKNGASDATPTPGGYHLDPEGAAGGRGSGGRQIHGEDGTRSTKSVVSGGGGGAGRIRINTRTGGLVVTGVISPDLDTPCATLGKLSVRGPDPEPAPPPTPPPA